MKKLVIPTLIALSLTACKGGESSFSNNDKTGEVIATVNGVNIVKEEVDTNMSAIPANLIAGREDEIRQSIIDRLIEQELVLQEADNTDLLDNKEFQKLYTNMRNNLAYNFMVTKAAEKAVSDEILKEEYEANKQKYIYQTVKARHILTKTKAEANNVVKKLKAGANFAKLAEKESVGPSAKTGGDLGWFKANDMVPSFARAAFALEKGHYTAEPVQTQFGWHVILVEDKKNNNIATFEMVEQPLRQKLTNEAVRNFLDKLKEDAKIEKMMNSKTSSEATIPAMDNQKASAEQAQKTSAQ